MSLDWDGVQAIKAEPMARYSQSRAKTKQYPYSRKRDSNRTGTPRPFISWDGEGAGDGKKAMQDYCVFGNSVGGLLVTREGYLSSLACLQFIIRQGRNNPNALHVGFGFNYDVNQILRDVPYPKLIHLKQTNVVHWENYRIEWFPGKWFTLSHKDTSVQIFDTLGFWNTTLLNAIAEHPDLADDPRLKLVVEGKQRRGAFTHTQIDSLVIPYFRAEMELHAELCERLRRTLSEAHVPCNQGVTNLVPTQWYGPSAIVASLYAKAGIKRAMNRPVSDRERPRKFKRGREQKPDPRFTYTLPDAVNEAARAAFAGGRFELYKIGRYDGAVYSYDLTSAYPFAMLNLPRLNDGKWMHWGPQELYEYRQSSPNRAPNIGFFRIEYDTVRDFALASKGQQLMAMPCEYPHPLFRRDDYGRVSYPPRVSGWYPAYSAQLVWDDPNTYITEAWVLDFGEGEHNGIPVYPFDAGNEYNNGNAMLDFQAMFKLRDHYREIGREDLRHAIKITLNSGYGKTAQKAGVELGDNLPAYHQLEWAAHITDHCRWAIYNAARAAYELDALISIETDAIYTTKIIPAIEDQIGPKLGDYKREDYDGMLYLQSGIYFTNRNGEWHFHYRGIDADCITVDSATEHLSSFRYDQDKKDWPPILGRNTHFSGVGQAGLGLVKHPTMFYNKWLRWPDNPREINLGHRNMKRAHYPHFCRACQDQIGPEQALHDLCVPYVLSGESYPRRYPWIDDAEQATSVEFPLEPAG